MVRENRTEERAFRGAEGHGQDEDGRDLEEEWFHGALEAAADDRNRITTLGAAPTLRQSHTRPVQATIRGRAGSPKHKFACSCLSLF